MVPTPAARRAAAVGDWLVIRGAFPARVVRLEGGRLQVTLPGGNLLWKTQSDVAEWLFEGAASAGGAVEGDWVRLRGTQVVAQVRRASKGSLHLVHFLDGSERTCKASEVTVASAAAMLVLRKDGTSGTKWFANKRADLELEDAIRARARAPSKQHQIGTLAALLGRCLEATTMCLPDVDAEARGFVAAPGAAAAVGMSAGRARLAQDERVARKLSFHGVA